MTYTYAETEEKIYPTLPDEKTEKIEYPNFEEIIY